MEFTFTGKIVLNGRGNFTYKWERGDGAIDTIAPHEGVYDGVNPAIVETTWTLGAATPAFHPYPTSKSTQTLRILSPERTFRKVLFLLDCGAGTPTRRCDGKPDLVPVLHSPMDGWVRVWNNGTGIAGPSVLTIKCQKEGFTGRGGGCVDVPAALITPPFFAGPGLGVLGVRVPELACGKEFTATMPWWASTVWPKGTYHFTATADATNVVAEGNEGNNTATSTLVKP